jgi:hypothetical protein
VINEDHRVLDPPWRRRGFHLCFENGWTLSIVWGTGTYSPNKNGPLPRDGFPGVQRGKPEREIAAWPDGEGLIEWADGDTVQGYVSVTELQTLIEQMQRWDSHPASDFILGCGATTVRASTLTTSRESLYAALNREYGGSPKFA